MWSPLSSASASGADSHSIQATSHPQIQRLTGSTSAAVISVGRTVVLLVGAIPRCSQTFLRNEERDRSLPFLRWFPQIRSCSPFLPIARPE